MSGRMKDSARYVENPDGSYARGAAVPPEGYSAQTKEELADELERRGLAKTGSKDELVSRLEESDGA